jgi:Ca-activated chloride channel family protein
VLVEQMMGTLFTIAKDVKIQVEFNPARVAAYRLIGYENRALRAEDFKDDKKDAGELGAGHTVTAFYEIVPAGALHSVPGVDPLKYQAAVPRTEGVASGEMMTVKLRYKEPAGDRSKPLEFALADSGQTFDRATVDMRFAAGVAAFGMILRQSPHKGTSNIPMILEICRSALGRDVNGYRAEFLGLVDRAARLPER